ncbi:MAG: hypothetical protein L7F77_15785, partial [Candidatus Magnetominusculus sp. LBB02]|nr:hypothetical protein [Candidatus Magnetominusculus sp. LBB02]
NVAMSDGYCEALAYMIVTQAQALKDKNKSGAFISLFLQSIYKQFGEDGLKRVIEEIKKELSPPVSARKQSPFVHRLRSSLQKRKRNAGINKG